MSSRFHADPTASTTRSLRYPYNVSNPNDDPYGHVYKSSGPEANPDFEATNERYEPRHRCVKILAYCRYCKRSGQNIGEEHYRGCRCYEGGWWEGLKWVERPKPLLDYEVRDHGCNACLGRRARMFKRMEKESRPNSMKVVERTVRRRQS